MATYVKQYSSGDSTATTGLGIPGMGVRNDSIVQINPTNLAYGFYSVDASGRMLVAGTFTASAVTSYQGTSPWIVSGNVSATQVGTWGVSGAALTAYTSGQVSAVQTTSPWVVSGNVSATQVTSPWVVSASNTLTVAAHAVTAAQSGSPWGVSGTSSARLWDGTNYASISALASATALSVVIMNASGGQITSFGSSPVTAFISGTATVSGNVSATQVTSPWIVSGNVSATQVTSPWVVSASNTLTVAAHAVTAAQSGSPWGVSGLSSARVWDGTNYASLSALASATALAVAIVNASGGLITSFGGGSGAASEVSARLWDGSNYATISGFATSTALAVMIVDSSGNQITAFGSSASIGSVTQGTTPWVVSGNVSATQVTSPWVVSASNLLTVSAGVTGGSIGVTGGGGLTGLAGTANVTQSTSPWVVSGNVSATQVTSPWIVQNTSAQAFAVGASTGAASSGFLSMGMVSLAGTSGLNSGGGNGTVGYVAVDVSGRQWVAVASGTQYIGQVSAFQTGAPWSVSGSALTAYVSGQVSATQTTSPWVVSGNVSATQVTSPWVVSASNTLTVAAHAVTAAQSGSPWGVSGLSSARLWDGTNYASISALASATALSVAIMNASGGQITAFGSSPVTAFISGTATVSGNVSATQVGTWSVSGNALTSYVSGQVSALASARLWDGTNYATISAFATSTALAVMIVDSSGNQITAFGSSASIGSVTQGTTPWIVSGNVSATQVTSPWIVSGNVSATQVGTWGISGAALTSYVSGQVSAVQTTSPWIVQHGAGQAFAVGMATAASSSGFFAMAMTDSTAANSGMNAVAGGAGYLSVNPSGHLHVWVRNNASAQQGSLPWTVSGNVSATQVTSPWVVSASNLLTVSAGITGGSLGVTGGGGLTGLAGTANVTQSTSPWVVSGNVSATQVGTWGVSGAALTSYVSGQVSAVQTTSPWVVQLVSATQAFTPLSATAAAQQGVQPFYLIDTAGTSGVNGANSGKLGFAAVNASGHRWVVITGNPTASVLQNTSPWVVSGNVSATQVTSPWVVSASNTVTVSASNTVTVAAHAVTASANCGQSTSPWVVSGNVSATQVTSPWVVSASNVLTVSGNNTLTVQGVSASGSTIAGNPVQVGGVGLTANPTVVSHGQAVYSIHDKLGKQVVVGSIRDLKGTQHTVISATAETTIISSDSTAFLDVYGLLIANAAATGCTVTIKDSTAGTTRMVIHCPPQDTRGFMLPESAALKQAAASANWTASLSTAVSALYFTALFVKNT